jgi:hypothetical protein
VVTPANVNGDWVREEETPASAAVPGGFTAICAVNPPRADREADPLASLPSRSSSRRYRPDPKSAVTTHARVLPSEPARLASPTRL